MPKAKKRNLTNKQQLFIQEYQIDNNATQAAIRAGYSEKTAYSIGQELLKKPEIKNIIDDAYNERMRKLGITQEQLLKDLVYIRDLCLHKKSIKVTDEETGEIKEKFILDPKTATKNTELLGKHLKMFTDKVQVGNDPDNPLPEQKIVFYVPDNNRIKEDNDSNN